MLQNYIKYALRHLGRNRLFSIINILGLTIGITGFLVIINFVRYEKSYDTYITEPDQVYRVNLVRKNSNAKAAAIGPPMGPAMKKTFPEVKEVVRFRHADDVLVRSGDDQFYENSIFYVDSTFFDLFPFPIIKGDKESALKGKYSVILQKEIAIKYFGEEDPIGKPLTINDQLELTVTAVIGEPASPSHFEFDMLIPFEAFEVPYGYPVTLDTWGWTSFPTYVKLHKGADADAVNNRFTEFIRENMSEGAAEAFTLELQPVKDIHLYSKDIAERDGIPSKGDIKYVNILIAIALLILTISVFNFTNLSTTLSLSRVREVGVRKTLGAMRKATFLQYIIESVLIALTSVVMAVTIIEVGNAFFEYLFGAPIDIFSYLSQYPYELFLIVVLSGLAGGAYPAIYLSRINTIKALKSKVVSDSSSVNIRTGLVTLQFVITIGLVAGSVVVYRQMNYMSNQDLGYNADQVLALQLEGEKLTETFQRARTVFQKNPHVSHVTASGNLFDGQNGSVPVIDMDNQEEDYRISLFAGNYDFAETMKLEFVQGRSFDERFDGDSSAFILNEAAVKMFGWKEDVIGKELTVNVWEGEVIGVVRDFHFASLHETITPLVIYLPNTHVDYIMLRLNTNNLKEAVTSLNKQWSELYPDYPFDYMFLNEHIGQMYEADNKFSKLIYSFAAIAIFLASMGLYSVVAFNINKRRKEIGIRKVLGASISQVIGTLTRQFLIMIIIAAFVALPLSWYILQDWLKTFAYKIASTHLELMAAFFLTFLIAMITIMVKTYFASRINPVDTLKEE